MLYLNVRVGNLLADELCHPVPRLDRKFLVAVVEHDDADVAPVVLVHDPGPDIDVVLERQPGPGRHTPVGTVGDLDLQYKGLVFGKDIQMNTVNLK